MKLKVKEINLSTGGPLIAVLNEKTAKKISLFPKERIHIKKIRAKDGFTCVTNISSKGIKENEIGLFQEAFHKLKIPEGTHIEMTLEEKPRSIQYIKKKLNNEELNETEIDTIIKDIVNNELSEVELAYFVSGCYTKGLSINETVNLTNSIVNNGERLHFKEEIIVDKHCSGGVAGNRTTMIIVPIIASLGYKMPKTSSRAITSASGTSDTMEVLAPVTLSKEKIIKVVNKTNGCMVWGGGVDLASADDKMITVRHPLNLDPIGMLLASILAKKKAAGATHVLIDIPYGLGVKVKSKKEAKQLMKLFYKVSKRLGLKIKVLITNGSQPIGNGIGPALEAADVLSVLQGDGPNDLREKAIFLATEMLKLVGEKDPLPKVLNAIESGNAYKKMLEIIQAQGGHKYPIIPKAKYFYNVNATKDGKITFIDNQKINKIATMAGAPDEKTAGVYLRVRANREIKKGTTMFTIYSNNERNIDSIKRRLKEINPITY